MSGTGSVTRAAPGEAGQEQHERARRGQRPGDRQRRRAALREAGVTLTIVDGRTHAIQLRRAELDKRFPGLVDALVSGQVS